MATKKTPGTAVVDWEAELAAQAEIAAAAQRTGGGGGAFFSLKAGQLSFDGVTFPGNMIPAIIVADIIENSYYDGVYNPDVPASPKCFAFSHTEEDLEPHEAVDKDPYFERQSPSCISCLQNEWGSAPTGKGKACKNVMRLALIPAGQYKQQGGRAGGLDLSLFDDDALATAGIAYLKVPVMSVRNYSAYVKQIADELRRPPHGVVTNISVVPDPKSQFRLEFEVIEALDGPRLTVVMPRHHTERGKIDFPYTPPAVDEAPKPVNKKLTRNAPSPRRAAR